MRNSSSESLVRGLLSYCLTVSQTPLEESAIRIIYFAPQVYQVSHSEVQSNTLPCCYAKSPKGLFKPFCQFSFKSKLNVMSFKTHLCSLSFIFPAHCFHVDRRYICSSVRYILGLAGILNKHCLLTIIVWFFIYLFIFHF